MLRTVDGKNYIRWLPGRSVSSRGLCLLEGAGRTEEECHRWCGGHLDQCTASLAPSSAYSASSVLKFFATYLANTFLKMKGAKTVA
mmetsp:Transcript_37590/g.119803  ORF Transcript_37590/g.119803 Transcript_37590/m.119803 type:complete len:86 (+) Transcript_37590:331-588(+)